MPSWRERLEDKESNMSGVSRFLSKREKKPKAAVPERKDCNQAPELCAVFTPPSDDHKHHLKKTDKDEEKKVRAITQRLTQAGISTIREPQIEYALRSKNTFGDADLAFDFLNVFEDTVEGIVREFKPDAKFRFAENREAVTCYLDALLSAMFARLDSFEALLFDTFSDLPRRKLTSLLRLWVNMLRSGKLITTDITRHLQEALAECGWEDARKLRQQDTSEAFTFITDTLQLPLLTLKMDIYHFGKEDLTDDHKVVHERLLEVAIPEQPINGEKVTLEECLENYFNNRVEVKRLLHRRNTLQTHGLRSTSCDKLKKEGIQIETVELGSRASSPSVWTPLTPTEVASPLAETPTSPLRPAALRNRTDSIFGEKRRTQDDLATGRGRSRASTIKREVLMPAWQFFSLIPWYTDDNPTSDAQVAAHFQTKQPVLGICLKRYKVNEKGVSSRLDTHVDIPLEIALPEFVSDEHVREDFGDFKLSLESVVCHRGRSTDAGHYISLVRSGPQGAPTPTWLRFDDLAKDRVTTINIEETLKKESPYLLFYQVQPVDPDLPPTYAEANAASADTPVQADSIPSASSSVVPDSRSFDSHPSLGADTAATTVSHDSVSAEPLVAEANTSSAAPDVVVHRQNTDDFLSSTNTNDFDIPVLVPTTRTANEVPLEPVTHTDAAPVQFSSTNPFRRLRDFTTPSSNAAVPTGQAQSPDGKLVDQTTASNNETIHKTSPTPDSVISPKGTMPTKPANEEANRTSWISNVAMSGMASLTKINSRSSQDSRRGSRSDKSSGTPGKKIVEPVPPITLDGNPDLGQKSAEISGVERKLSFSMSRFSGKSSKEKFAGGSSDAIAVTPGDEDPTSVIKVEEVASHGSSVGPLPTLPSEAKLEARPTKRTSFEIARKPVPTPGHEHSIKTAFNQRNRSSSPSENSNGGIIGRSRSLRVKGYRGFGLGGGDEGKKKWNARSASHNRLSAEIPHKPGSRDSAEASRRTFEAAAAARPPVTQETSPYGNANGKAKVKESVGVAAHSGHGPDKKRPERECVVM